MVEAQANDAELLDAYARTGSQEAFAQLVQRHIDMVHLTARRMLRDEHLAEDATQAVFLLLSRRAGRLRQASVAGWLYLVTTYTVRNMQRQEGRRRERERAAAAESRARGTPAGSGHVDVDAALARLRPGEREALVLRYMQNLSVPQVAAGLGISEVAAGKRLVRAMASLRRILHVDEAGATAALAITGAAPGGLAEAVACAIANATVPAATSELATATGRGLFMLPLVTSAKLAVGLLVPLAIAAAVYSALPAGDTPPAATRPAEAAATGDVVAIDPAMSLWWIDPASRYHVENGELLVHNPTAKAGAFHGWIGGPSWEDHHVSLEFLVERNTSTPRPHAEAFDFNIQIAPHNSSMFFQLMGRSCNICVNTPEVNAGEFTHVSDRQAPPVALNRWYRLEVISDNRQITMLLDGTVLNEAHLPCSTRGMLGLLVNFNSDAMVRIRNMQVTLLEPNAQQLAESQRGAKDNWMREYEQLKQAGKPLPPIPWQPAP